MFLEKQLDIFLMLLMKAHCGETSDWDTVKQNHEDDS